MVELGELRIPTSVRPYAEGVVAVTDAVCAEHLDAVYADLCRRLVGKLARKRPSPLTRGDLTIWAASVIYCLGQVNFIFDPSQSPHASADELSAWLGVKKSTMANKARMIRESAGVSDFNAEFLRPDAMESVGLVWLVQVDWHGRGCTPPPALPADRGVQPRTHPVHTKAKPSTWKATSRLKQESRA